MESIVSKLEILNCPKSMYVEAYKHLASLNLVSTEELNRILGFLMEKGILTADPQKIILKPSDFSILTLGYDEIVKRVSEYETINELNAIKEKPGRLNSKSGFINLKYLKDNNELYKNEENKYNSIIFSKAAFNKKYHNEVIMTNNDNDLNISKDNNYDSILNNPQTVGLNEETFERYEILSDHLKQIIMNMYQIDHIDSDIINNLIKLVTNNIESDFDILFNSIIHNRTINEDDRNKLKEIIRDELEYTNIMDVGRLV